MIEWHELEECCGAGFMHNFWGRPAVKTAINNIARQQRWGVVIAITSPKQIFAANQFKDLGFRPSIVHNSNNNHKLKLWKVDLHKWRKQNRIALPNYD